MSTCRRSLYITRPKEAPGSSLARVASPKALQNGSAADNARGFIGARRPRSVAPQRFAFRGGGDSATVLLIASPVSVRAYGSAHAARGPAAVARAQSNLASEVNAEARAGVGGSGHASARCSVVSRRRGKVGVVTLRVSALAAGRAAMIEVLRDPSFPRRTGAALQAVRRARFQSTTLAGTPVGDTVRVPSRFIIEWRVCLRSVLAQSGFRRVRT